MVETHPPLGLSQNDLTKLNERMNDVAYLNCWEMQILRAGDDRSQWSGNHVQPFLVETLSTVTTKAKFVSPLSLEGARLFFEKMNVDEFREWQEGVRTGIRDGNWAKLAAHRTC